jgi:ketosteroid isomerase-like protein
MTSPPVEPVIERYFAAMQLGPEGHDALAELFAPDAEYVEPFSGRGPHRGRGAIRAYLAEAAAETPPDLRLHVERLDFDGERVTATWRCESPLFVTPSRGRDTFVIREGHIHSLETTLLEPPTLMKQEG